MSAVIASHAGFNKDQSLWLVLVLIVVYLLLGTNFFSRTGLAVQRFATNTYKGWEILLLLILALFLGWYYWKGKNRSGTNASH